MRKEERTNVILAITSGFKPKHLDSYTARGFKGDPARISRTKKNHGNKLSVMLSFNNPFVLLALS